MLSRRLQALGYHHPNDFDINNESQIRNLVVWLEDKKIRYYAIDQRKPLRDVDSKTWFNALKQYLKDLNCPVENLSNKTSVITWLLNFALHLEYKENASMYNSSSKTIQDTSSYDEFLNSISCDDPMLENGIKKLQDLLKIPYHPHQTVVLQAIVKLIEEVLSDKAIEKRKSKKDKKSQVEYLSIDETSLGFNTNDAGVNEAAKIIRLLHIQHLRELQTYINQAIVQVQKESANPKTDQSLGKVGSF